MLDVVNSGLMDDSLLDSGLENADDFLSGDGQNVGNLGKEIPEKIVHNCETKMFAVFLGEGGSSEEWFDPAEPRYCVCNQVSYGDMVACDNHDVSKLFIFLF